MMRFSCVFAEPWLGWPSREEGALRTGLKGGRLKAWNSHWVTRSESGVSVILCKASLYHVGSLACSGGYNAYFSQAELSCSPQWPWVKVVPETFFPAVKRAAVSEASASRLSFFSSRWWWWRRVILRYFLSICFVERFSCRKTEQRLQLHFCRVGWE